MNLRMVVKIVRVFILLLIFNTVAHAQTSSFDYLSYAVEATENGDYTGAIVLCNHSISLNNSNELAFYHRGYNRLMIGDFDGAIEDATRSIELNDRIADTYLLRAEARMKKGERFGALSDYNRARRIDGSVTISHLAQNLVKVLF